MEKNKIKNDNFFDALKNAINGILYTVKTQINIIIQIIIAIITVLLRNIL